MKKEAEQTFLEFIAMSRADFVTTINEQDWNTEMRTAAEDLINCFDQMRGYIIANEKQLADNQNEVL